MTLRVVVGRNIRFSALIDRGTPGLLVQFLRSAGLTELISQPLLDELDGVLKRKSDRSPDFIAAHMAAIKVIADFVSPQETITAVRDPDDNRLLECAVAGRADLIITGDLDLLTLEILPRDSYPDSPAVHRPPLQPSQLVK